ncbi:MAG: UDP-N-acetylglucosamine 2-epimerase (non-hydrolyzing) [Clostridiales bacterium]|jgi:UDP-N-acetylglucosamine 2-epimerase (non-hydrolysing)|nr:UDP-N-acetylglucosamine 2-epimerase (non-hydrolyzing) [Clostridiales bacterium]
MHITLIAGARPNFMKIAPIIHAVKRVQKMGYSIEYRLVHTGQHYDHNMSQTFFEELDIPRPDVNLGCGGGTQAEQTANIMVEFEKDLMANPSDLVMVVGDVTSTMACSIVAKKLNTKVAHVEAGIRSWDVSMPEEINRMVTDVLADYYFTTSETANENLRRLGVKEEQIHFVGNVMIDTLLKNIERFKKPAFYDSLRLNAGGYLVLTLHRPANVDEAEKLKATMKEILHNVDGLPVIFPIHPRTARVIEGLGIQSNNLHIVDPLGYLEFNYLVKHSKAVITDSGGITEETTVMGIPCLTLRDNTERPETVTLGTNELVGTDPAAIKPMLNRLFAGLWKKGTIPGLWDGKAAERIVRILVASM